MPVRSGRKTRVLVAGTTERSRNRGFAWHAGRAVRASALGVALLVAAGCGTAASGPAAPKRVAPPQPASHLAGPPSAQMTVMISGSGGQVGTPAYAEQLGMYRKYHLNVRIIHVRGGATAAAALVGGHADVGSTTAPAVLPAMLKGQPLYFIANFETVFDDYLVARPNIHTVADLHGQLIAAPGLSGGFFSVLHDYLLPRYHLTSGPDPAKIVSAGSSNAAIAGVISGRFAATLGSIGQVVKARKAGMIVLLDPAQIDLPWFGGFIVSRQEIQSRPGSLEALLRAQVDTIHAMKTQQNAAMSALGHYYHTTNQSLIKALWKDYVQTVPDNLEVPIAAIAEPLRLVAQRPMSAKKEVPRFIDNSLVNQIAGVHT